MDIARLKKQKKELKMTYEELSQRSGVPVSTIYDMFRGVTAAPRIDTVQAIERALGLVGWTAEEKHAGVGNHPVYLNEGEMEWQELRSEILRVFGQEYLDALILLLEKNVKLNEKKA